MNNQKLCRVSTGKYEAFLCGRRIGEIIRHPQPPHWWIAYIDGANSMTGEAPTLREARGVLFSSDAFLPPMERLDSSEITAAPVVDEAGSRERFPEAWEMYDYVKTHLSTADPQPREHQARRGRG